LVLLLQEEPNLFVVFTYLLFISLIFAVVFNNTKLTYMKRVLLTAVLAALSVLSFAQTEQAEQEKKTKTPEWVRDLASRIEIHGYMQGGYEYNNQHYNGDEVSTFNLKRFILYAKARITDRWSFLFMHDVCGVVQEFYTDYRVTKNNALSFRIGQFKNNYSLENPYSPHKVELVEIYSQGVVYLSGCGSDPLYGVQYGRDLGIMARGDLFKDHLHYELAVMNGQGVNRKDKNKDKDVILKLAYSPIPSLKIVATGQKGRGHAIATSAYCPDIKVDDDYTRDRFSVGSEYKSDIFNIRGEYVAGKDGNVGSQGWYATASAPLCKKLDIVGSYDYFNYNTKLDFKQTNATLGLQYWFYPNCRVQAQYTRCFVSDNMPATLGIGGGKDFNRIQCQVQVGF